MEINKLNNVEFTIEDNFLNKIKINPDFKDEEMEIVLHNKVIESSVFIEICQKSSPIITIIAPNAETIGNMAFYKCQSLKSITLPKVKTIKIGAFFSCESLESIQLDKVETIEDEVFRGCSGLKSIYLPNVKSIGSTSFGWCDKLKSIELPSYVNISEDSFCNCDALNHVKIRYNIDKSVYYVYVDKVKNDKNEVTFEYRSNLFAKQMGDIKFLLNKIFKNDKITVTEENLKYKGNIMNYSSLRSLSNNDNVLDKKIPKDLFDKIMEYDGYKPRRNKKNSRRNNSKRKSRRNSKRKRSNKKKKSKRRN